MRHSATHPPSGNAADRLDAQPLGDLLVYLRLLAGEKPHPGQRFDVRWRIEHGRMAQRFIPAERAQEAARLILRLGQRTDVYVGVALRRRGRGGGRAAIEAAHLLYVDLDTDRSVRDDPPEKAGGPAAPGPLACFALPTLEIASGSRGGRHLYWLLTQAATVEQVESANRRLAAHLGGDLTAADLARVLRPPMTVSFKYDPPRPVRLIAYREDARYTLTELTDRLPADPADPGPSTLRSTSRRRRREPRTPLDRNLLAIPAAEYVRVLAGLTPDRAGRLACPFHDDRVPSLQLYEDGSWFCFGCRRGGSIYDFAAALTGSGTRGRDFVRLREWLAETFEAATAPRVVSTDSPARRL